MSFIKKYLIRGKVFVLHKKYILYEEKYLHSFDCVDEAGVRHMQASTINASGAQLSHSLLGDFEFWNKDKYKEKYNDKNKDIPDTCKLAQARLVGLN